MFVEKYSYMTGLNLSFFVDWIIHSREIRNYVQRNVPIHSM